MHPDLDLSGVLARAYRQQRVGEAERDRLLQAAERAASRRWLTAGGLLRRLRRSPEVEAVAAKRQWREAVS